VGASLIAWLVPAIHEVPAPTTVIGGLLVLVGIGLSVGGETSQVSIPKDGLGEAQH